jgi:hypothetical protein
MVIESFMNANNLAPEALKALTILAPIIACGYVQGTGKRKGDLLFAVHDILGDLRVIFGPFHSEIYDESVHGSLINELKVGDIVPGAHAKNGKKPRLVHPTKSDPRFDGQLGPYKFRYED